MAGRSRDRIPVALNSGPAHIEPALISSHEGWNDLCRWGYTLLVKPASDRLERLLDSDASPFERALLEGVNTERPSAALTASMERALGFSGVAAVSVGAGTGAGAAAHVAVKAGVAAKAGVAKLASVLFVGAGLAGVGAAAVYWSAVQRSAADTEQEQPAQLTGAAQVQAPRVDVVERQSPRVSAAPGSSAAESSVLREEIEAVDAIRRAIQLDQYDHAHALTERHAARFPEGALRHEVRALKRRVELALQNRRSEPSDRAPEAASRR